jgi:hypothetical protein
MATKVVEDNEWMTITTTRAKPTDPYLADLPGDTRSAVTINFWLSKNISKNSLIWNRMSKICTPDTTTRDAVIEHISYIIRSSWDVIWKNNCDIFKATRLRDDLHTLVESLDDFDPSEPIFRRKMALEYAASTLLDVMASRPPIHITQMTLDFIWNIFHITMKFPLVTRSPLLLTMLRIQLFRNSEEYQTINTYTRKFIDILYDNLELVRANISR